MAEPFIGYWLGVPGGKAVTGMLMTECADGGLDVAPARCSVPHLRLSKQALIDLVFFCGVPIVLAMLSAVLGPYTAIMGGAGATAYVLSLAIVPWPSEQSSRRCVRRLRRRAGRKIRTASVC